MESNPTSLQATKASTPILLLVYCLWLAISTTNSYHTLRLTWQTINSAAGKIANSNTHSAPWGTWFPNLHVDSCDLVDEG